MNNLPLSIAKFSGLFRARNSYNVMVGLERSLFWDYPLYFRNIQAEGNRFTGLNENIVSFKPVRRSMLIVAI